MRKIFFVLLMLIPFAFLLGQTSKFEKRFLTSSGQALLGATIQIVPQANTYPTGALLLTQHPTRAGWYYRDGVPVGEYKIYINGVLYTEHIFQGEEVLANIAGKFDSNIQLTESGIKDAAVTWPKLSSSVRDSIQKGRSTTEDTSTANGFYINPIDFSISGDSVSINRDLLISTSNIYNSVLPSTSRIFPEPTKNVIICNNATNVTFDSISVSSSDIGNGTIITIINISSSGTLTFTTGTNLKIVSSFTMAQYSSLTLLYIKNSVFTTGKFIEIGRSSY